MVLLLCGIPVYFVEEPVSPVTLSLTGYVVGCLPIADLNLFPFRLCNVSVCKGGAILSGTRMCKILVTVEHV